MKVKKLNESIKPQPNGYHNIWPITDNMLVHNDGGVYHVVEKQDDINKYIFNTENLEELNSYLSTNYGETIVDPEPKEKPVEEPKKRYPLYMWKAIEDAVAGMNNIPDEHKEAFISLVGDRATTKRIPRIGWKSALLPAKLRAKYGERANYNHLIISPEYYNTTLEQALTDIYDTMKPKWFNESLSESIEVSTIADYITDHYKFETIDDKYSCIDSIRDSFKDEKTISKEELEQFIGAHNGKDKVDESKAINESKTGYQYKGYVICYGYKGTDRWYVKDSSNNFVGTKSGYSTEVEAKEYVNDLNESMSINEDNNIEDELAQFKKDINSCRDLRGIEVIIANISDEACKTAVRNTFKKTNTNTKNLPELKNALFATYKKFVDDNYTFFESITDVFGSNDDKDLEEDNSDSIKEYETLNKGEWVEYNLSVKKDVKHIIPVKVAEDLGKEFYGWAWGEGYHRYNKSRIVGKIDMANTDEIIRKYTNEDLNEASYGGAFDIADDQIFTREDIDNLAEEVLNHINETYEYKFDISAAYIDGNELEVGVKNDELGEYITTLKIDMRKVKEPWHLKRVYAFEVASDLINQISRSLNGLGESLTESATEDAKPIETGAAVGMATVLSDLIKDEYEAIDGYNTAIATAEAEGFGDMIKVLTDIQAEENIHIGQLQELMKMVDPNASKIEDGTVEAEELLSNPSVNDDDDFDFEGIDESFDVSEDDIADEDVDAAMKAVEEAMKEPNKEEFDLTNANFDLEDDDEVIVESTEPWEDIYNSFKDIEVQLNGDGEAITATIDRIYNDNKGNPDFEKAYKKWAANE